MDSEPVVDQAVPVEAGEVDRQTVKDLEITVNCSEANAEPSGPNSSSGSASTTSHPARKTPEERLIQMQLAQKQAEEKRLQHMLERKQKIEDNRRRDEERRKKAMEKRRELDEQRATRLMATEAAMETATDSAAQQRMAASCYVTSTSTDGFPPRRSTTKTDSQTGGVRSVSSPRCNTIPRGGGSAPSAASRRHSNLGPAFGSSTPRDTCTQWGGATTGIVRSASSTPHPHAVSTTCSPRHRHSGCHIPRAVDPFSPFDRWRSCSELRIANAAAASNTSKKRTTTSMKGHVSSLKANSRTRSATTTGLPGRMTHSFHTFDRANTGRSVVDMRTTEQDTPPPPSNKANLQHSSVDKKNNSATLMTGSLFRSKSSASVMQSRDRESKISKAPQTRESITKSTASSRGRSVNHAEVSPDVTNRNSPIMSKSVRLQTPSTVDNISSKTFVGKKHSQGITSPRQPLKSLPSSLKTPSDKDHLTHSPQEMDQDRMSGSLSPGTAPTKASIVPSHSRVGSEPVKLDRDIAHRRTKSTAAKLPDEMSKSTVTFSTMDHAKAKAPPARMMTSTYTPSRLSSSSKKDGSDTADAGSTPSEPKTIRKVKKASASATESKVETSKVNDNLPSPKASSPAPDGTEEVANKKLKEPNENSSAPKQVESQPEGKKEEIPPCSTAKEETPNAVSEEEDYRRKLAEQRRLKREAKEREEKELQRQLEEAKQRAAEERERMQREAKRIQELEAQRKKEEEEERLKKEEELRQQQEEEARKQAEAREDEKRRQQQLEEEALRAAEKERLETKRRVDAIMSRVAKADSGLSSLVSGGDAPSMGRFSLPPAMTTSAIYLNGHAMATSAESSQSTSLAEPETANTTEVKDNVPAPAVNHVSADGVADAPVSAPSHLAENKTQFKSPLLQSLLGEGRLSSKNMSQLRRSSGPGGSTPAFQRNGTSSPTQAVTSPPDPSPPNSLTSDFNANNVIESSHSEQPHPSFPVRRLLPAEPISRFTPKDGHALYTTPRNHLPTSLSAHTGLSIHCIEEDNMNKENTEQITDSLKNELPTVAWGLDLSSTNATGDNTHKTSTDHSLENCTDSPLTEELNF